MRHSVPVGTILRTIRVLLLVNAAVLAWAGGAGDLLGTLGRLTAKDPVKGTLTLKFHKTTTHDKKTKEVQGEVDLGLAADAENLNLRWTQATLRQANEEESARDRDPRQGTPLRDAMKDLDPGRLSHLLDQGTILRGLIAEGTFVEEKKDTFEGRDARMLVFSFPIRLTDFLRSRLIHSEGRLKVWVGEDGVPLGSESVALWNGKTSRFFGAFEGRTIIRTQYQKVGDRLIARHRQTEEWQSDDHQSSQVDKTIDLRVE